MTSKEIVNINKFTLPISSIKEIIKTQISLLHDLKKSIDEQIIPWVTSGVLDHDFNKTRHTSYSYHYDIPLKDPDIPAENLLLTIPKALIEKNNIIGGEYVTVIGYLKVNYFNNQFSVRFQVNGLYLDGDNQAVPQQNKLLSDFLKRLIINRDPFPINNKLKIAVITPESGDALSDFTKEIVYGNCEIINYSANFISKEQLLERIRIIASDNTYNILVLIRGGGAATEFGVFDDLEICQEIAAIKCHKIIGLGHSSNRTLLELVVDNALHTPTAVGRYINSSIQKQAAINKQNNNNEINKLSAQHNLESLKLKSKIKFRQTVINILLFLTICFGAVSYYMFTNYKDKAIQGNNHDNALRHIKKK